MESNLLKNKIAFVTGSTRGIGLATANLFAKHGATVLINGISDISLLNQKVYEIQNSFSVPCEGFLFDVSNPDEVKKFYTEIFKKYKKIDILVNNAGIFENHMLSMITLNDINKSMTTNLNSVIFNMQYASRLMQRNNGGSIINLTSIMGKFGSEGYTVYSSSKSAVIGATLSASKELAKYNIRVNAVAPGLIETDMTKNISRDKIKDVKMNRIGVPEDVANAILFLASDLSSYITGQVLGVDGGMII